jgi:hypothetical protein
MMPRSFIAIRTRYAVDEWETMPVNLLLILSLISGVLTILCLGIFVADLIYVWCGE